MKRFAPLLAGFLLIASIFTLLYRDGRFALGDPDRYYHFALSREMVKSGEIFLRSLPQVEDLGWGELFVDKEFLYHQLTALGYRLGGDAGVEIASLLCSLAAMLVLFLFASRRLPPALACSVTFLTLACPLFLSRMLMLRPHVLAVFGFSLMTLAVLSRRPLATGLAVFFFTLSYHAFYVPLICLAILLPLSFLAGKEAGVAWRKVALAGVLGCLCGIIVNPYFPGNVVMSLNIARITGLIQTDLAELNFGLELIPMRSDVFLESLHLPILVLFFAFFALGRGLAEKGVAAGERRIRILYLMAVAAFFLMLSFQSRRAAEYLLPASGFLLVYALDAFSRRPRLLLAGTLLLGALQSVIVAQGFRREAGEKQTERFRATKLAVAEIPAEANGAKVYNCEWDFSPYLFYFRPDLRFVDILDPSLLYFEAQGPFRARDDLRKGALADAYGMIRHAAKAEFVLCNDPTVNERLRTDPDVQQLFPKPGQGSALPSVFRLAPEASPQYARAFLVSGVRGYEAGKLPAPGPAPGGEEARELVLKRSTYLDLSAVHGPRPNDPSVFLYCGKVSVAPAEIEARAGASFVALGGGQGIEIYRNGKPLFRAAPAFSTARSTQVVVPLVPPLVRADKLELVVCSSAEARFWGLSLSLWKARELEERCEWKTGKAGAGKGPWPYLGSSQSTCIGQLAAPAISVPDISR